MYENYNVEGAVYHIQEIMVRAVWMRASLKDTRFPYITVHSEYLNRMTWWLKHWGQDHKLRSICK